MDSPCYGVSGMIRSQFPFFSQCKSPVVFMENAGGSQCPGVVIDAISGYMRNYYVQVNAGSEISRKATGIVEASHEFMKEYMNGREAGEVVFGGSTSQLLTTLSEYFAQTTSSGDQVVVQESNHEANVAPWVRLACTTGASLKFWPVDCDKFTCSLEALEELITPNTRLVAVTHVSNLLGEILELDKVVEMVKVKTGGRGRVVADGVAFAPHRALDVQKWGVDWYVFSSYKVYGPHMAVMFGSHRAFEDFEQCQGSNFYFLPPKDVRYKFELGCVHHESCAGVLALWEYLKFLARLGEGDSDGTVARVGDRVIVEAAFEKVKALEEPLQSMLLTYLRAKPDVVIVGQDNSDVWFRVPTISFVHKVKRSSEIVRVADQAGIAIRNGHAYAHRLVTALHSCGKLYDNSVEDGVVRVSMLHYNTLEEVDKLIQCLDSVL